MRNLIGWLVLGSAVAVGQTAAVPVVHPVYPVDGPLAGQVQAIVGGAGVSRAHWGIAVTAMDGTPLFGLHEGEFLRPASNAKLYTTAAAMALLGPEKRFKTRVLGRGDIKDGVLHGDVVLQGGGDANFAGGYMLPYVRPALRAKGNTARDPLADFDELAAAVAAKGIRKVDGNVLGNDRMYKDEPYAEAWSIDDMLWGYGAPVSALTVHDNQVDAVVSPNKVVGEATLTLSPEVGYFRVNPAGAGAEWSEEDGQPGLWTTDQTNREAQVTWLRRPGSRDIYVNGEVALGKEAVREELAIEEPALFAAMALKSALARHGVVVTGTAMTEHAVDLKARPFMSVVKEPLISIPALREQYYNAQEFVCTAQQTAHQQERKARTTVLAQHVSAPLGEDVVLTNKVSQNLHAEMMLRNIAVQKSCGRGSLATGAQIIRAFWMHAGLDGDDFVLYDGSGLSVKDLVTARATASLLAYAATQPWFAAWKASLPVGGEDGTLGARFGKSSPLKDHLFAKTGTLGESRALSGYLDAASGRSVIFSVMVDTHAPGGPADRVAMDKVVEAIAAAF